MRKLIIFSISVLLSSLLVTGCIVNRSLLNTTNGVQQDADIVMQCFNDSDIEDERGQCIEQGLKLEQQALIMVLQIDLQTMTYPWLLEVSKMGEAALQQEQIAYSSLEVTPENVLWTFSDEQKMRQAISCLSRANLPVVFQVDNEINQLSLDSESIESFHTTVLNRYVEVTGYRLNQMGFDQARVLPTHNDKTILIIPGVTPDEWSEFLRQLGAVHTLQFRLGRQFSEHLNDQERHRVSLEHELLTSQDGRPILLSREVLLTQDHVQDISMNNMFPYESHIQISFNAKGVKILREITYGNIGSILAVVVVDESTLAQRIIAMPIIRHPIEGGNIAIALGDDDWLREIFQKLQMTMNSVPTHILGWYFTEAVQ